MRRPLKDEIEFQPDAIEIKNERMPFWLRYSVFSIFLFFACVIAWSIVCKVDVIVQAQGKLVTNQQPIRMQPLERSVIKEVNVVIGQHVRKGDILFTFDPTMNQTEADRLQNDISIYQAKHDRLKAEFHMEPFLIPDNPNVNQREQMSIFQKRAELYESQIRGFDETLKGIEASRKSSIDAKAKENERLKDIQEIEEADQGLADKKIVSRQEYLQIRITRMEFEATIDRYENEILKSYFDEQAKKAEKNSFEQQWHTDIADEYVAVRQQLETAQHDYEKVKQLIEYVHLRAPCDAVVHQIAAFSFGSAVREAETLITLIPLNDKLEMEAELRPQDIGKVKVGSKVRVKISAFPFQRCGTLDDCVVRDISSDTIIRGEGASAAPGEGGGGGSYYRARISISGRLRNLDGELKDGIFQLHDLSDPEGAPDPEAGSVIRAETHPFIPGMEATAEIKTGKRRIIEYLVYPLIKAFDETAREP